MALAERETADHAADSVRLAFYHDETKDDDDEDDITGNPVTHSENLDVTALRLAIKGYVANDGQEGDHLDPDLDQIVRGDEAVSGIELELVKIVKVSTNKKDTTFSAVIDTQETEADGSYSFDDVEEGSMYVVRVSDSGDNVAATTHPMATRTEAVAADEYPTVTDGEFALPYWDYNANETKEGMVEVSNTTGTVKAEFQNFALLYVDGTLSGRVMEASGADGNIPIELIRCDTYTPGDATAEPPTDGECTRYDRKNYPTQTEVTSSSGHWEFNDLLEGWYDVNIGDAGYISALIDSDNKIDDDADDGDPDTDETAADRHTRLVKGRRDLAARNDFYVYDRGLANGAEMTALDVEGIQDVDDGAVELDGVTVATTSGIVNAIGSVANGVLWADGVLTLTPTIPVGATFKASVVFDDGDTDDETTATAHSTKSGGRGDDVDVQLKARATGDETTAGGTDGTANTVTIVVTAEDGYNDEVYTFTAARTRPVDNGLTALAGYPTRTSTTEIDSPTPTFTETQDEYSLNVPVIALTAPAAVYVRATAKDLQEGISVVVRDGTTVKSVDPEGQRDGEPNTLRVYAIAVPRTGLISKTVELTVTSEDGVDKIYYLTLDR